jgi:hypothetical protein
MTSECPTPGGLGPAHLGRPDLPSSHAEDRVETGSMTGRSQTTSAIHKLAQAVHRWRRGRWRDGGGATAASPLRCCDRPRWIASLSRSWAPLPSRSSTIRGAVVHAAVLPVVRLGSMVMAMTSLAGGSAERHGRRRGGAAAVSCQVTWSIWAPGSCAWMGWRSAAWHNSARATSSPRSRVRQSDGWYLQERFPNHAGAYSTEAQQAQMEADANGRAGTLTCGEGPWWMPCLPFASRGSGVVPVAG